MQVHFGNITVNYHEDNKTWLPSSPYLIFIALTILCVFLQYFVFRTRAMIAVTNNLHFFKFQQKYFYAYYGALFGDWLQGPYIYKLYSHYGFISMQIAMLYAVGFSSSIIFGTLLGTLADYFGRKKMCMIFCITYSLSCALKLSHSFDILILGSILGGISTSLLFSVFESWYIYEHIQVHDFPKEWISKTFSRATFTSGMLAIGAGIVSNIVSHIFGTVSPFMFAIPCFFASFVVIYNTWDENYGSPEKPKKTCSGGIHIILTKPIVLLLGIVQSLFESVMYVFVFLWTPILDVDHPPLGMIFAAFMICIMIGSTIHQMLIDQQMTSHQILLIAIFIASTSMSMCAIATSYQESKYFLAYVAFLLLEVAVGMYYPAIGVLKSKFLPESHRASIMNLFRVPVNLITCVMLLWLQHGTNNSQTCIIFIVCTILVSICVPVTLQMFRIIPSHIEQEELITA